MRPDERQRGPAAADEAADVPCRETGDRDQGHDADDVVVDEWIDRARRLTAADLGERPRRQVHHRQQDGTGDRGGAKGDAEDERDADAEEPHHEQPVDRGDAREIVERRLERSDDDPGQEARGRGSAVDPGATGGGGVAEPERLVEEGPEELEADCEAKTEKSEDAQAPARGCDRRRLRAERRTVR